VISAARPVVLVAALGGLAGLCDGVVRGMPAGEALAASGWCAMLMAVLATLAWGVAAGLTRVWARDAPALARTRAVMTTGALGVWAAGLVVLGDRFSARFSAIDLAALLWAVIGGAVAACLASLVEPVSRRLAARRPVRRQKSSLTRAQASVSMVLAIAIVGACAAAIVRGAPVDPRSLGAMAAHALRG
jgi:hypothetical protein